MAAALTGSGTSKSGRPIERLIGSLSLAARSKTFRMPEASTPSARFEMKSPVERMGFGFDRQYAEGSRRTRTIRSAYRLLPSACCSDQLLLFRGRRGGGRTLGGRGGSSSLAGGGGLAGS